MMIQAHDSPGRESQEDQKLKVIFQYIVSSRSSWDTWESVSENQEKG